jgi:hypothetical protein
VSSVSVQLIASRAHQKSAQEDFSYLIVWDDFWFALVSDSACIGYAGGDAAVEVGRAEQELPQLPSPARGLVPVLLRAPSL